MNTRKFSIRLILLGAIALLSVTVLTAAAQAAGPTFRIMSPASHPFGLTYGDWGGKWYQWALAQPVDANPVLDTTGVLCAVGQKGPVWFLAGTFGGKANRKCTIPKNKALFFPVYNQGWIATEPDETAEMARQYSKGYVDQALAEGLLNKMSVKIDGVRIKDLTPYRVYQPQSINSLPIFNLTVPDNNLLGLPAGTYGPASTDGYYLMLAPLSPGQHTIRIVVEGFLDARYNLTVK